MNLVINLISGIFYFESEMMEYDITILLKYLKLLSSFNNRKIVIKKKVKCVVVVISVPLILSFSDLVMQCLLN